MWYRAIKGKSVESGPEMTASQCIEDLKGECRYQGSLSKTQDQCKCFADIRGPKYATKSPHATHLRWKRERAGHDGWGFVNGTEHAHRENMPL